MAIHHKTITELTNLLKKKELSALELTQYFLQRIKKLDASLNSFITITEEEALQKAKEIDALRARGKHSSLMGIPIAHKDILCVKEVKTTCASKMLENFIAPYDATVVRQLNEAGTILLGKTNMDEFAMGSSNESSYFGPVKNPWDITRIPGGSSGGSAAAIAARLIPAATGTDTGGSIRQPGAMTGISCIKPTYGRISRYGLIAFASSLDQAGPMAKTAEDCALLLNVMSGFDPQDSTSADHPVPDFTSTLQHSIKGLKIGLPQEFFTDELNPQIARTILDAAKELEKLGATLQEINLPRSHLAIYAYYIIASAECSSNLARYDGIRYGHRCQQPKDLTDLYERTREEGFGDEVKHRIMIGTSVLSSGYYDAYYLKAAKVRRLITEDFMNAFKKVDIILGPTTPTTAFKLGSKTKNRVEMYLSDIYTIPVNLAGLPGMSIPAGIIDHLPVGLQLIGNHFDEARLLNVAHQFQQVTDYHQKMPEEFNSI